VSSRGLKSPRRFATLLAAALALAAPELAARPRISVARGSGAAACPDAVALEARVEAILGRPLRHEGPPLGLDIEIFAEPSGLAAVLRVTGGRQGVRSLRDDDLDCSGLAEALALMLAMLLEEQEREPAPGPAPPLAPAPPPPPAPATPSAAPPSWWRPWAGGGLATGWLPGEHGFLTAGASWHRGALSLGLGAFALSSTSVSLPPGQVDVRLQGGLARACWQGMVAQTSLGACGLMAGGFFQAAGEGFLQNRSARPAWWAPGAGLEASRGVGGPLEAWLRLDALVALRAQRFQVEDVGLSPALPRVGAALQLGLALRL
jgi:hypothetical protein